MLAHAFTCTCYFYSKNVKISHPIEYKEGLGYLSVCAIASRSSPPTCVSVTVIQAQSYVASTVHHTGKTGKGKVIPLHAIEVLGVRGGIAPTHS
jgi:hypothetical protein